MRFLSEQWSCETELHEKPSLGPEGCFEAQSPAWCLCPSHQPVAVWLCTLGHNLHLSDGCSLLWPYLLCGGKASVRCSGLRLCSHFQCSTQRRNYGRKSLDAKKKNLRKILLREKNFEWICTGNHVEDTEIFTDKCNWWKKILCSLWHWLWLFSNMTQQLNIHIWHSQCLSCSSGSDLFSYLLCLPICDLCCLYITYKPMSVKTNWISLKIWNSRNSLMKSILMEMAQQTHKQLIWFIRVHYFVSAMKFFSRVSILMRWPIQIW